MDQQVPYLVVTPACSDPKSVVSVEGFHFYPNTAGPIGFIPPSDVTLPLGEIAADGSGHFKMDVTLPGRPDTLVQYIRAVTRRDVGAPHLTQTARDTWEKIIETVFLALLATTLGTALAIPASFLAARNIMKDITSPLTSVVLGILFLPAGLVAGAWTAGQIGQASQAFSSSLVWNIVGLVGGLTVAWLGARWALPQQETAPPGRWLRATRSLALLVVALIGVLSLFLLSHLALDLGAAVAPHLGGFGFLGSFIGDLGDVLGMVIALLTALLGAAVFVGVGGGIGRWLAGNLPRGLNKALNVVLGAAAGATLVAILGAGINWLYQIDDPLKTLWIPAGIGAAAGIALVAIAPSDTPIPVGMAVYYATRTLFNGLRSIEPLIMVIVFAVWVGIGPFAGVLALSLHTTAALAKLFSEQVESILSGPLEAVRATGATKIQTVVYAVIPQIVPPYISFTMYRWDTNVRMSTIIGFAGGGGIGFLLQQNINLLNYRAASAQMLAIAIVVASMDYLSSQMRERVI